MRRFLISLAALGLCLMIASPTVFAAGKAEKKSVKIAIVPVALNNPIFLDAIEASQQAGKALGAEIVVAASTNPDATEQVKVVEGLIEQKVDGIMIFPTDPVALRGVVDKAVAKGIVHKNQANNKKSKLALKLNRASTKEQA